MQYIQVINTPLGKMTLLSDDEFLLGSWFEGQKHFGGKYDLSSATVVDTPILQQAKKWLLAYFAGEQPNANELQANKLSRAVGNAIGTNPFVVFIPCHRVLGSDGSLTGYAAGLGRKSALLTLERVAF
ncbi:methylated-DNA--[protein]-cysteine S-methyltransferase [Weissella hellenica]|uniref:methylated-DNA--[protein]-cysteine S-methyltransferase n=1 Tax=Weissella hellenica TaxID=46256 RepID=UPI003885EF12